MSAKSVSVLLLSASLLAGCNTYMQQRADLASGGPQNRVAAAQANLTAAKNTNQNLQDELVSIDRDIERNEKRLAAAQDDLKKTNADLAAAQASKKISSQQHAKLKAEADAINRELATLDLQLQADRGKTGAGPDVAAKEARLKDLERRKADLEKALKAALNG